MLSDTGDMEFRDIIPEKISANNCNLDTNMYSVFNVGLVESECFLRIRVYLNTEFYARIQMTFLYLISVLRVLLHRCI